MFFQGYATAQGYELWRSDGTEAGTFVIWNGYSDEMANVDGTLFFLGDGLWKSDGTEAGTIMIANMDGRTLTNVNGTLFFVAYDSTHGSELWTSDGTEAGTVMVKDVAAGSGDAWIDHVTSAGNVLFFTADDGIHGHELWKSDGTEAGTVMVKDINPDSASSVAYDDKADFINVNGTLFFTADDGIHGKELWKSDGTENGTVMVKDIASGLSGSWADSLAVVNGILFFTADDGVHGLELWKTDGTEAGTVMVKDIIPGFEWSGASKLTNLNGTLFFVVSGDEYGGSIWKSDGTEAGTVMVAVADYLLADTLPPTLIAYEDGILYYEYRDQLWKSDGSGGSSLELTIEIGGGEGVVIQAGGSNEQPPAAAAAAALGDGSDSSGSGGTNPSDLAIKRFVFDDGTVLTLEDILARANAVAGYQEGTDGSDVLQGDDTDDEIYGGEGNDAIRAGAGNDIISGGPGTDIIEAGPGDDVILGLEGGDTVLGGQGNDTYYYHLGDGKVSITDVAALGEGNTIVFGEGISADDIELVAHSDTLTLQINDNGDEIDLAVFDRLDVYGEHAVDTFVFADGTSLSYVELLERGFDISGSESDDMLIGTSGQDRITGLGGDDIMESGPGSDLLEGGSGNDTYVFNLGDGVDTIRDAASPGAGNVVDFGIGITSADLTLSADGNTLVISVGSTGDALRLEGFDPENPYSTVSIETFRFADGTVLDAAQLLDLGCTFEGTPADDTLTGTGARDLILGHEGDDQVLGGLGDDTYIFNPGDGNDTIIDRSTALEPNMLIFGAGILSDTVTLSHDPANNMLILNITSTRDTIRLSNFDSADPYGEHAIEYFQFGDGRILTYSQLIDKGFDIIGTPADDTLTGTATTDRIVGGDRDDTLSGGTGGDTLTGGAGNDTYVFHAGDGIVTIDDSATASEGNVLQLGEGIALSDIQNRLTFRDNMLIIRVGTNGDEVHLTGFDPEVADVGPRAVQTFEFFDGTVLSYEELVENTFIVQGDSGDDDIAGTNMTDRLYGYEGFDRLNGGQGNDTLTGGTGSDELIGGSGSDLYVFHLGDGVDTVIDTAFLGEGNQILFDDEGITADDITTYLDGTTLVIAYGNQGDKILLSNFDYNAQNGSHVVELIELADGTQLPLTSFVDPATDGDDVILGTYYGDTIDAKGGNDTVTAFEGGDTNLGGTGDDTIDAGPGDDRITGGAGIDMLVGGEGQDTYVFNLGDGVDTIVDTAKLGEGNVIEFGAGITKDDISVQVDGTTLTVHYGNQGDAIVLPNFDYNTQHVVETLQFADGSSMRLPTLVDPGTERDDVILGSYFEDVIHAKGGNDTVTTYESDDTVYGGAGHDIIDTGAGFDLIVGGHGNDTLTGGPGHDTYVFNVGDGVDTIIDTAYSGQGNVVRLGPGITLDDLTLRYEETTLVIDIGTGGDGLRLSGFDREDALGTHAVDRFEFSDGTAVTYGVLIDRGFDLKGTPGGDTILGTDVNDRIQGLAGNDTIRAGSGSDVLDGGPGADTLVGGPGDDLYVVDDEGDVIVEEPDEGMDTVQSSTSYSLGANLENLLLIGYGAINGSGNDLNNLLVGNSTGNVLAGGKGNDTLKGGAGDDVYLFGTGDGLDTVTDTAGSDTIRFGQGVTRQNISVSSDDAGIHIRLVDEQGNDTGEGLDINVTEDGAPAVETIEFSDGSSVTIADLLNPATIVYGTDGVDLIRTGDTDDIIYAKGGTDIVFAGGGNDTVLGGSGSDMIFGEAGSDTLYGEGDFDLLFGGAGDDLLDGGAARDVLSGGTGNDTYIVDNIHDVIIENFREGTDTVLSSVSYSLGWNVENLTLTGSASINGTGNSSDNVLTGNSGANKLSGGYGSDTLDGGAGSDILEGGLGNDTYLFGHGSRQDRIVERDWTPGNTDKLVLGAGVASDQLWLRHVGYDLEVSIIGTQDKVTIADWYKGSAYRVEEFKTSDGKTLLSSNVDALVSAMAAFAPPAAGQTSLPANYQAALNPLIAANWR